MLPSALYNDSLATLTDLCQLTMAYGYWKLGISETEAIFSHFFRQFPVYGGYDRSRRSDQAETNTCRYDR